MGMHLILAAIRKIEARQLAYGMHDPDCPAFMTFEELAGPIGALFRSKDCTCWLSEETQ